MNASTLPRVVVTGVGLVTPAGPDRESSWLAVRAGQSATRWLEDSEFRPAAPPAGGDDGRGRTPDRAPAEPARFAGAPAAWPLGEAPLAADDPVVALARRAADEAFVDAGLVRGLFDHDRAGCVIGTSKGGLATFTAAWRGGRPGGGAGPDGWWDQFQPAAAARQVAGRFDLRAAALCPLAACATGLVCVARGAELIREGVCDLVLAGSSDASLHPAVLASYRRLGVLSRRFDEPAAACRPFDRTRDGFAIGEGSAVLVLERLETALSRGARPRAEWLAGETASDAADLTRLDADPRGLTWLIAATLRRAGVGPDEIDYVNLHGTATRANDLCETRAVRTALGRAADSVSASSLKGALGHLLGAAGSVELALTLLAMRDQIVPPTANLREHDRECDLDYTPLRPRARRLETALKLSLGFGGHLAAAVVRAWR